VIISWNITRACNLACRHCYRDAGARDADELSLAEGKQLLAGIARAGFKIVVLSGGEPLMRDDVFDLISEARAVGMRPVLGTNGTLITPQVAGKLKEAGLARAGISLDSRSPDFHNSLRGDPDAWQKAVEGMGNCKDAGLEFQVHTTVTEHNRDEVLGVTDFAVEIGAAAHHVFFLVPAGRAVDMEEDSLRAAEYEKLIRALMKKQSEVNIELKPTCAPQFMRIAAQMGVDVRFSRGCLAGVSYCVVTPTGDVNPCPYLPLKVGNVREQPFWKIWEESDVFGTLRSGRLGGKCGPCRYRDICAGCRARAYFYSGGDYMAEEPWCAYRPSTSSAQPPGSPQARPCAHPGSVPGTARLGR
jgi:putative heme d1 biosynthesis radical SAM protein NirJ2